MKKSHNISKVFSYLASGKKFRNLVVLYAFLNMVEPDLKISEVLSRSVESYLKQVIKRYKEVMKQNADTIARIISDKFNVDIDTSKKLVLEAIEDYS